MASDLSYLYQFRLILIGDSKVGKSSLLRQFTDGRYLDSCDTTVGVDFHAKVIKVDGCSIKLQIWDTAGQERFRAITRAYYRNAVGGLLVFDITNEQSFRDVPDWLEDARECAKPHKPVFVLVGHKSDLTRERAVSREEAQSLAQRNHMQYIETSAKITHNIDDAFVMLSRTILQMLEKDMLQLEDGWDGVKKGEPYMMKSTRHYTTVSLSLPPDLDSETANLNGRRKGGCCGGKKS